MSGINHRTVKANGINIHVAEQGEGPLVIMVHGFPESWYSWRHQLPALAEAGFHAVALDMRGYGRTDAPPAIEDYDIKHLTADVVGVIDALGEQTAVIVGHDWGAMCAWNCALLHASRFRAVAGLSVPYTGRAPMPPTQLFEAVSGGNFFYILYFQEPGIAEAEFESNVPRSMRLFLWAASGEAPQDIPQFAGKPRNSKLFDGVPEPDALPPWLTQKDLDYFVSEFQRTGFRGGINWYRNFDRNWELTPKLAGAKVKQPALFIAGDRDGVIRMVPPESMRPHMEDLRKLVMLPGCGHWTQQERPAEVNAELIEFLRSL
ncbi:MAG: alpha/beta hydrolase [Dehalococcoidia bacterium]